MAWFQYLAHISLWLWYDVFIVICLCALHLLTKGSAPTLWAEPNQISGHISNVQTCIMSDGVGALFFSLFSSIKKKIDEEYCKICSEDKNSSLRKYVE